MKDYCDLMVESLFALPSKPSWVPCDERLPKETGVYLVSGKGKVWVCEFRMLSKSFGRWIDSVYDPIVEAWMQLPESYRCER